MANLIHVPSHPKLKLGLHVPAPPRLLHFDTIKRIAGIDTSSPLAFDYSTGMPPDTGMLGNDVLGDCTAAAKYHRFQIVVQRLTGTFLTGALLHSLTIQFYSLSTGYDPNAELVDGQNPTDQGGDMQTIAEFLISNGMPTLDGKTDKFTAAFMIDPTNTQDLVYCGKECIGIDFGIQVTTAVMPADGSPPPDVWQAGGEPLGGHDVFSPGFMPDGNWKVNSWAKWFEFTSAFAAANVTQAVCYVSEDELRDGKTVMGLDMQDWQSALTDHYANAA